MYNYVMNLVNAVQLSKSFGERILLSNLTFAIGEGERIGFIGANGTGKTTLLKILCGLDKADSGSVAFAKDCRIGVMEQDFSHMQHFSLQGAALEVFAALMDIEAEMEQINLRLEKQHDLDALIARQHALQEKYADGGGLTYRSRARAALLGLGFSQAQFGQRVATLSGGEQAKLKLARLLLRQAPLLLLDEPTNHLDIPAMQWLEEMLRAQKSAVLAISHDRWFLESVTQRTFLLEDTALRIAEAPYTEAMRRFDALDAQTANHAKLIRREVKRLEQIIAQQRRWNRERNIRMAQSKQKVLDKLQKTLPTEKKTQRAPKLSFAALDETSADVLQAVNLSKSFGERTLFTNVSLHVGPQERLFILGPNGCGKTTLLKLLALKLAPDNGVVKLGPRIKAGYYDQTQAGLNAGTVLEEMTNAALGLTQPDIRNALAGMGFYGDDVHKCIEQLSGGEKARICLLKLMLSPAHLLLLDEPTNHLDIVSREALEEALLHYEGALVIVSHDRYFMRRLGSRWMLLTPEGLRDADPANFSSYRKQPEASINTEGDNYRERKAQEAQARKALAQIARCEEAIAALEREMEALRIQMASPEVSDDYQRLSEMNTQLDVLNASHDQQLALWLSLQG